MLYFPTTYKLYNQTKPTPRYWNSANMLMTSRSCGNCEVLEIHGSAGTNLSNVEVRVENEVDPDRHMHDIIAELLRNLDFSVQLT